MCSRVATSPSRGWDWPGYLMTLGPSGTKDSGTCTSTAECPLLILNRSGRSGGASTVAGTDVEEAHVPAAGTVATAERASAAGANAAAELSPLSRGADNAGRAPTTEVDTTAEHALPVGADTGVKRARSTKGVATSEGVGEGDSWAESTPVLGPSRLERRGALHLVWG
jgi:hypothetical protein